MSISREEKERLALGTKRRQNIQRLKMGGRAVLRDRRKAALLALYLFALFLLWTFRASLFDLGGQDVFGLVNRVGYALLLPVLGLAGLLALLWMLGTPWRARVIDDAVKRAGIANHAGETPMLCRKHRDAEKEQVTILEFWANGVPVKDWKDKRDALEMALNMNVVKITEGTDKRHVLLHTVPAKNALPHALPWQEDYLHTGKGFTLVLGESLLGPVTVDLAKIPHVLLGGSTGSGKTELMKLILHECICKGAEVYLADFKGGVDYPGMWRKACHMVCDETALLDALAAAVDELEHRKERFPLRDAANIDEYNQRAPWPTYDRIIFAFDEVAEVLDKTGLPKEQKELVAKIESKLSMIARQGRAFGIHLILSTQRPDATILSGQIRNNIDFRVCGRADSVLSQIILDNTSASDQISPDAQGRFITKDGILFQAYLLDEANSKRGEA